MSITATGAGFDGYNVKVIASDTTPDFLDAKLGEMKRIAAGIESQIATLTAYRKSLIHECVTGQRRITEADINRVESHG